MLYGNQILDTLPEPAKRALRPFLRCIFLIGCENEESKPYARDLGSGLIFPVDSLVRASRRGEEGRPVTLMAMGRRCVVGMNRWIGDTSTELSVLEPGRAWKLSVSPAQRPLYESILGPSLNTWIYRTLMVTAYRMACNTQHNVDRRLANSLLWIIDETGRPHVSLTHKILSELTTVRRPSVSLALSDLQRRGIVRTSHGSIGILDRKRLELEACSCYASTRGIMHEKVPV
jgi:CRP-like cAMP-binding protein